MTRFRQLVSTTNTAAPPPPPPPVGTVGSSALPDLSGLDRFTEAEYLSVKAANEVVIDPAGGGDYLTWEQYVSTADPVHYQRPVCLTFRKGSVAGFHATPAGPDTGRIRLNNIPGTGKIIVTTDGVLPNQSAYDSALVGVPSNSDRIYPSQQGELAWFETPASPNATLFYLPVGMSDVWFRGVLFYQNQNYQNSRGFWQMDRPTTIGAMQQDIQWDRCIMDGGSVYKPTETRRAGALSGKRMGFFDCYMHRINVGPSALLSSSCIFVMRAHTWAIWNCHLETVGHLVYVDALSDMPDTSLLPKDGLIAYCHMDKPASWDTNRPSDFRPKTMVEFTGGDRLHVWRCLMERHHAAIDGQPCFNIKVKHASANDVPLDKFHSRDMAMSECWMYDAKEPLVFAGGGGHADRFTAKDIVMEKLGRNATGALGGVSYFLAMVIQGIDPTSGLANPSNSHMEGLTFANADTSWCFWVASRSPALTNLVTRNMVLAPGQWGPFSTTQGGDGAVSAGHIDTDWDGDSLVIEHSTGTNFVKASNFDDIPGMFDNLTIIADTTGLYVDPANGDYSIAASHAAYGTGAGAYSNPGGAENVIAAIGIRGAKVRSLEVNP